MEPILYTTHPRAVVWAAVIARWGDQCFYCEEAWDDQPDSKWSRTVDHYDSIDYGKKHGWSEDKIHSVTNLRPAHKTCNARKANREWIEGDNGTVLAPKLNVKLPKAKRPDLCDTCMSGRLLLEGETCPDCGSDPQPRTHPKYNQREPKDCQHGWGDNPEEFCWFCTLGFVERRPAVETALINEG